LTRTAIHATAFENIERREGTVALFLLIHPTTKQPVTVMVATASTAFKQFSGISNGLIIVTSSHAPHNYDTVERVAGGRTVSGADGLANLAV